MEGGQVTLMQWTNGQISGTVQHDQHFYSIRPLGDRIHAIVEMSEDRMPPEHPQAMLTSSNELLGMPPGAGALVPLTRRNSRTVRFCWACAVRHSERP
jgi:hypothetical protein